MTEQNGDNKPATVEPSDSGDQDLTFWQMLSSVMAAAFGVQSSRNRQRDFSRGKPMHFIIIGIGFTAIFVVVMILLVRLILSYVT